VRFVGAPQTVHGGIVAAVLDEIMGLTNYLNGAGSFTGEMTVRFHRPTPIETDLELLGETVSVEGRKVRSRAEIRVEGELCASAHALFIRPR
jgi:acyl-coenzyme A thioesterase PaaI-like protein